MTSVVVIGINSFHNRGVEALSVSICEQLLERWPDADITVLCKQVAYNESKSPGLKVTYRVDAYREFVAKACYVLGTLFTPIPRWLSREFAEVRDLVRSADLVVSTGGDNFGKDYGPFQNHLTPFMEGQEVGAETVFLGQSIGPFKSSRAMNLFRRVARRCSLTTCRESLSYDFCLEQVGIPKERTALVGDVAFLLKPVERTRVDEILKAEGVEPDERRIVLSISGGISKFSEQSRESHLERWVQIIRRLKAEIDARIIIVPHVWNDTHTPKNNDMVTSLAIKDRLADPDIVLPLQDLNAKEYKGIIGSAEFVVAERMHAAIAGLSQGVPTVAISYSVKADGIIGDLFEEMSAKERPVIAIDALMVDEGTADRIVALHERREELQATLSRSLPQMLERARLNFDLLSSYF